MIDEPMLRLVQAGKIFVGLKLIVSGAELVGGEEACTPLEVRSWCFTFGLNRWGNHVTKRWQCPCRDRYFLPFYTLYYFY
ncbi:hypothetical protein DPMN_104377 [Dreissena polymorpha]|uniref:BRCA2 OB1 domain-containing protein n=1 Tax=Dreissena polymorpha TaxID=45954 RepID=A0A9D4H9U4_DREPO|nr:hypothetical protein DPMN_104377 [Dreissena polymorpha]